jgi:putative transposase
MPDHVHIVGQPSTKNKCFKFHGLFKR